jgi:hypothetical protein
MTRIWRALLVLAGVWIAMLVHRGAPLAPDEVEFFRATRWIAEGRVPFRDFWEHHGPLQWMLFAPVASFANGPGVASIVTLRWAQVLLWIGIAALLLRITKRHGANGWIALVLLLVSATFVRRAVEYRVDVPGNLAFLAALAVIATNATRARWIAFGALMSLAVLANIRLAPLAIVTATIAVYFQERRPRAAWMVAGVAMVSAASVAWLSFTGAWAPFMDAIVRYNTASAKLLEVETFFDALLAPFWALDIGGIAFWLLAIAGAVLAWRGPSPGAARHPLPAGGERGDDNGIGSESGRRPDEGPRFLALIAIASVLTVALMEVQYDYHFQTTWLLALPLVAVAIERMHAQWRHVTAGVAAVALAVFVLQIAPAFAVETEYQDDVMKTAERYTAANETVFDGAGYALRREPAYRYWFLTTGVRMLAESRVLPPYGARDMAANPPAAVIADYRLRLYLESFPELARYTTQHYLPLYRNLWLPGMTALITRPSRVAWVAPRAGAYDVWASESLATHPWLTNPLQYAAIQGPLAPRYVIPLRRLPPLRAEELQWSVDGIEQPRGVRTLALNKGSRVELHVAHARPAGVLLVPHGIDALCLAPADDFLF